MATCACKGIRSCLVCEVTKESTSKATKECSLELQMCYKCGTVSKANKSSSTPPLNPLWACSPACTIDGGRTIRPVATDVNYKDVLADFEEVVIVKEFVSPEEETSIVADIDHQKWAESQSGRRKQVCGVCGVGGWCVNQPGQKRPFKLSQETKTYFMYTINYELVLYIRIGCSCRIMGRR